MDQITANQKRENQTIWKISKIFGKFVKCEISQITSFPEYIPDSATLTAGFVKSCVMLMISWYNKLLRSCPILL